MIKSMTSVSPRQRWARIYMMSCCGVLSLSLIGLILRPWVVVTINQSKSLPLTLILVIKGLSPRKGSLVAYRWHGAPPYPAGLIFIKYVTGVAGDVVQRENSLVGATYWVSGQYVGRAKSHTSSGFALQASPPGVVGASEIFVSTNSPDSFDSRYAESGNIALSAVIGRAYAIF